MEIGEASGDALELILRGLLTEIENGLVGWQRLPFGQLAHVVRAADRAALALYLLLTAGAHERTRRERHGDLDGAVRGDDATQRRDHDVGVRFLHRQLVLELNGYITAQLHDLDRRLGQREVLDEGVEADVTAAVGLIQNRSLR